jgi:plasmid stabilization system protein ParE
MVIKEIVWSDLAQMQLKQVLEFYMDRNGNPNYSKKLLDEVDGVIHAISANESIGRLTSNKSTRVVVMKVYALFYEVHQSRIEIVSFWDCRQDPSKSKIK